MRYILIAMALLCSGCQEVSFGTQRQRQGSFEENWTAEDKALMRCLKKHGDYIKCVEFGPQRRMHGVWYTGFEESGFVPDVKIVPLSRSMDGPNPEFDTRLEIDERPALRQLGLVEQERCIRAVAIEFIGRQATKPDPNHIAPSGQLVVVDRLLGGQLIGRVRTVGLDGYDEQCATPAPSEAELKTMDDAGMKRCRAEGRCISWKQIEAMGKQEKK